MATIQEAQEILRTLGLPPRQHNEMAALTLLALCGLGAADPWSAASRHSVTVTKGIMGFISAEYGRHYAPNTRETFRRQVLHQFVQARLVDYNPDDPNLPTNSPRAHYAISEVALLAIRSFGTEWWNEAVRGFLEAHGSLLTIYGRPRTGDLVPVRLPSGDILQLSPGKHNRVQAAVIEEFAPRFAQGSQPLYLGDTANKALFVDTSRLASLGIPVSEHGKLPDIVLYEAERGWLFLIEAVTSHGPMSPKRVVELQELLMNCRAGRVFVSAFPDLREFRRHLRDIAWETEVWIMEIPDHLIHFNGDRFLGPH